MLSGGAVTLWQFRNIRDRVSAVSVAEQRAAAVMRAHSALVMLMSRLHRSADSSQQQKFENDAESLLNDFRVETAGTVAALQQAAPESGRQRSVIDNLSGLLESLPARVASLVDLARAGDWGAVHARLTDQVDHTDEVGEQLMRETSADLSQARNRLFQNIEEAEHRIVQTLLFSSVLGLIVAGVLGMLVTQSITRPLAALDRSALAVSRGDFGHEVPVTGTDELAHVASAFNRMARELADLYEREREARRHAEHLNQTLRHANEDLSVFAYSASHDLQEPLRGIALYSQLLQRKYGEQLDEEAKEFIDHLLYDATRMSELIKDLLAYMEVSGSPHDSVVPVSSEAALGIALANLRAAISANDASVTYGELPAVAVEPIHLQQLFQNLIGNAIKYRSEDPPYIIVSANRQNGKWQFSIRDNGIGVEPEYRRKVFGPFQRLQARSKSPGTGIGLSICQKIVERYGGQIWIESAPEKGSDFRFTLPNN